MANHDIIKFQDTFYLKHKQSNQYLVVVDRGRYNWPQLGNTGKIKLQLQGGNNQLENKDDISIRSLENVLGKKDYLGAFSDSHDCYYWTKDYNQQKQGWTIEKVSTQSKDDLIRYGDEVRITNNSYQQVLVADQKHTGYITTKKDARDTWILESTAEVAVSRPSSSNLPDVFQWSVASGDPTEKGVILWTRVNPETCDHTSPITYEVCSDKSFASDDVITGEVKASEFGKERDYTVLVDLDKIAEMDLNQQLASDQLYYYRFIYRDTNSPVGRCRTLPKASDKKKKLKLAVLTCNDYSTGYFNAFYHLAEETVDFVIHLGDFAYEYPQYPPGWGELHRTDLELDDQVGSDETGYRASSLNDFRKIYRTYRQDKALQAAMEQHTWIVMLDDHEIADDAYWNYIHGTLGANPSHPIYQEYYKTNKISPEEATEEQKIVAIKATKEKMSKLYQDAMQAWTEYVPARWEKITDDPNANTANQELFKLRGEHYKLYKRFRFGNLVDFYLTDSRTYRDEAEGNVYDALRLRSETSKNKIIVEQVTDAKADDPNANVKDLIEEARKKANDEEPPEEWQWSMLGPTQKQWLLDDGEGNGIEKSTATWQVWGNQTLLSTCTLVEMGAHDDWHGFKAERYEILQRIKDSQANNKKSNFVVFTGDMHTSLIAYLKTDFEEDFDPFEGEWSWNPLDLVNNKMNWNHNKLVGVEFMTPSVTAPGVSEGLVAKAKDFVAKKGGSIDSFMNTISPATGTVSAAASSVFGTIKDTASTLVPDVIEDTVSSVMPEMAWHKQVTSNIMKSFSPHIEHFDSQMNGYAIAEFSENELEWKVFHIDKTVYDKADGGNNISTRRTEKKLIQSVKYNPDNINLHDWYAKLA